MRRSGLRLYISVCMYMLLCGERKEAASALQRREDSLFYPALIHRPKIVR